MRVGVPRVRTVVYGYDVRRDLGALSPIVPDAQVNPKARFREQRTLFSHPRVAKVSLGCHVPGAVHPCPDVSRPCNMIEAARGRFCHVVPPVSPFVLQRFSCFVGDWLRQHFVPLDAPVGSERFRFDEWLSTRSFPQARKAELQAARDEYDEEGLHPRDFVCKLFVKDEDLPGGAATAVKYKLPRDINARPDKFKVFWGPYCSAAEAYVYSTTSDSAVPHPYFIKHVPVRDRPSKLREWLGGDGSSRYACTDHSFFEAHSTPEIAAACELQLYDYLFRNYPEHASIMKSLRQILTGDNICAGRGATVTVPGVRMSGDMNTSLGNGFLNLMMMHFVAHDAGCRADGVVEGDDGIAAISPGLGHVPTALDFKAVGMDVKLEMHGSVEECEFCGIYQAPDGEHCLVDPVDVLVKFGWSRSTLMRGKDSVLKCLLRAKAFSLAYEAPSCPITRALADYALRVTSGATMIFDKHDEWWNQQVLAGATAAIPPCQISIADRHAVEKRFGVSVADQVSIEQWLNAQTTLHVLDHPAIVRICASGTFAHAWQTFVAEADVTRG